MKNAFVGLVVLASTGRSGSTPSQDGASLERIKIAVPNAVWVEPSTAKDDFDCDGRADIAYLGRDESDVLVGIVAASKDDPRILRFGVAAGRQDAICAEPAILRIESMDYDPAEPLPRRAKDCNSPAANATAFIFSGTVRLRASAGGAGRSGSASATVRKPASSAASVPRWPRDQRSL